jgi:hypothetical protein
MSALLALARSYASVSRQKGIYLLVSVATLLLLATYALYPTEWQSYLPASPLNSTPSTAVDPERNKDVLFGTRDLFYGSKPLF